MIQLTKKHPSSGTPTANLYIFDKWEPALSPFDPELTRFITSKMGSKPGEITEIIRLEAYIALYLCSDDEDPNRRIEKCRRAGDKIQKRVNELKYEELNIHSSDGLIPETLAMAEGIMLGSYQFISFRADREKKKHPLSLIVLQNQSIAQPAIERVVNTVRSVFFCRDLVNLPANHLNTLQLADRLADMIADSTTPSPITIEVLNKKQLESLKMGGLLAVNRGSVDPPVFIILEYKPENAVNNNPLVLVGKGVTYDTGGLSLKTGSFMDNMKLDMGGAAAVATALQAIATEKIPLHTIVLIPATDNRPDGNAMTPGDIITMYDGTTVEVLNTDAEGRLILADALAWANRYNPMLVVDVATLTGAAARAIGSHGIVAMHQKAGEFMPLVKQAGEETGERIAEFPFWDDYDDQIKSEIADLKNLGGPEGGAITAGKFLAHFTRGPFVHLDIAGPVFLDKRDSYRGIGATGSGVRLLIRLAEHLSARKHRQ